MDSETKVQMISSIPLDFSDSKKALKVLERTVLGGMIMGFRVEGISGNYYKTACRSNFASGRRAICDGFQANFDVFRMSWKHYVFFVYIFRLAIK